MSTKYLKSLKPKFNVEEFVSIDEELKEEDNEDNDGSDEELNHSKLLNDISLLDTKKNKSLKWKATRFEATEDVNEFNLSKSNKQISINDLLKSVKYSSGGVNQLRHWHKKALLDTPLDKPLADKVKRIVAYEETTKDISKWDSVVNANRNASQMKFPLNQQTISLKSAKDLVKHFIPKTKLELEVSELLNKSENTLTDDKALTVAEEKILKAMSIEEARLRHKELQKMRALLSYEEVKLKRQSKIKSKRYHRILKRERLKKSLEEFEDNKKSDPKAAIDKLAEMEKLRALERASLKHKNTGKWAKHLKIRSKYDESARIALSVQLQINQQLVQKRVHFESDEELDTKDKNDSESDDEDEEPEDVHKDSEFKPLPSDYNPWLRSGRNNRPKAQPIAEEVVDEPINFETSGHDLEPTEELVTNKVIENKSSESVVQKKSTESEESTKDVAIDPNDFIAIKSHKLKSSLPDVITELDSDAESADESDGISDDEQRRLVSEAFADDDVINDFKKEKMAKIENEDKKDINLHLPGWGTWGGNGIKPSNRKLRKFTVKAHKKQRKDHKLGNVIISEKKDETIAKYRVSQIPFPFKNVSEFENSIRQPIGRTFNPEIAFRELTAPKVITKMGAIIEPIDSEALIGSKEERHPKRRRNDRKVKTKKSKTIGNK